MKQEDKQPFVKKITNTIQANYATIFWFIILCVAIVFIIWNWGTTSKQIGRLISVLSPFIIAIFLAYLVMPLMKHISIILDKLFFRGKGKKACYVISIIFSYIIIIGIIVGTLTFVFPQVMSSIRDMELKKMLDSATNYIKQLQQTIPILNTPVVSEKIKSLEPKFMEYGTDMAKYIVPVVFGFSKSIVNVIINFILSIVISCYMIVDKKNITWHLKRLIFAVTPKQSSEKIWETMKECNHIFNGFLIGKILDSFIIGVLCFILLTIFQFPYALLMSVAVGITNVIPYFGPFIGAIPGVVIYLLIDFKLAIFFAVLILALQQFDGLYLGPKILGDLTGLKPLWIIFAITVGGAYFGVLGMFLGVPIVAVISYLLNMFIEKKIKEKNLSDKL